MSLLKATATAVAGVAGAVLICWPLAIWYEIRKLEKPKYVIVKPLIPKKSWLHGGYVAEVRRYAPYIIAEVEVQAATIKDAGSAGFRQIARYIFGGNTKQEAAAGSEPEANEKIAITAPVGMDMVGQGAEKIAMTSPVGMDMAGQSAEKISMTAPVGAEEQQSGKYKVWFMMPGKYSLETLPKPNNPNVSFREVPAVTMAALTFPGYIDKKKVNAKQAELMKVAKDAGITLVGDLKLWQYHPPFTVPWQRRNEVLMEVQGEVTS